MALFKEVYSIKKYMVGKNLVLSINNFVLVS